LLGKGVGHSARKALATARRPMHFGKHCQQRFSDACPTLFLPALPYKELKKRLKPLLDGPPSDAAAAAAAASFFAFAEEVLKVVDSHWSTASTITLRAAQSPVIGTSWRPTSSRRRRANLADRHAGELEAWAALACEALRKILKKYNKRCGASHGYRTAWPEPDRFAFVRSGIRTQIASLARGSADANSGSLHCPVCLETFFRPVAPSCGHALCRTCHASLARAAAPAAACCPICRAPARVVQRMVVLDKVAKKADPKAYIERKQAEEEQQARFPSRAQPHLMEPRLRPSDERARDRVREALQRSPVE